MEGMKPDLASTLTVHDHAAKPEAAACGGCCGHQPPVAMDTSRHAHDHGHDHHDHGHAHAAAALTDDTARAAATGRTTVRIEQMDCPTEERMIRAKLGSADGVVALDFNLLERHLTIHHTVDDVTPFLEALRAIGMDGEVLEQHGRTATAPVPPAGISRRTWWLGVGGVAAFAAEAIAWSLGDHAWPVLGLALASIALAGGPTLRKGWIALRAFTFNINFLMAVAVIGALLIGKWAEAAMVIFLFAVAEAIEARALVRARDAVRALTAIAPDTAELADGAGGWRDVAVGSVAIGARLRVRTGSRVPVDARVVSGRAALDESPVTGESLPVEKAVGDTLLAGTIVTDGVVEAQATAVAADSTLARIAGAIQEAQSQRAPTQRFVDRFSSVYTPAVMLLALAVAIVGPLVTADGWLAWTYRALVLLVIACPCALVISTPVTVVSGLAAAARRGIVVKGGVYLESGRRLRALALDKTGTLTAGRPMLDAVVLPNGERRAVAALRAATDREHLQALAVAAALDANTTHPIAVAIVQAAAQHGGVDAASVEDLSVLPGRGVAGTLNGVRWHLGNAALVADRGLDTPAWRSAAESLQAEGMSAVTLCDANGAVALFGVRDRERAQSAEAIAALRALGVTPVMLTGDDRRAAWAIARTVGIENVHAEQLPADKQRVVGELAAQHGFVGMVGDGINDAPALARADIGFAMGAAGTATALEAADVAIMDDDPRKLASFIRISRRTVAVLRQNIVLALGIKAVFLALAVMGDATLWMAIFADVGASLLVVFNGLRVMRARV
ncbi:Probable cadmium-transporting ATPase [Ralstonia mannitolilytica]|uniref:P-type Zn(2+) transporter n=2 Tax=Ralstonia mannitolilytica TaxID=105219 RepID=A0AAJ4ZQP3_9RALS|nr:Potassium-transporting ATPase ATP-binding subunit [Ralstonia mannitolilytica]CAJ0735138.1 Potassium-transporting ATPase ATP-binding subunit [Ralstonia mannitolilytica]SUE25014.1 Probable cadmium-transporting ATPase [Ralstonia mannitolilytica]SUE26291.1 Probable cadmium-transporting ATPase [Ralstonia mannitolilytica]SUE36101.1 Probable cadmium-transporting ATPase [Ralstonia mannitolilytica]